MERTTSTFNFSCPHALLLAAALALAIEVGVGSVPREAWGALVEHSNTRKDRAVDFWGKLEFTEPSVSTVYLIGSSQVREGVDANLLGELLSAELGKNMQVVNLGGNKLGMPELYLQLDVLLPRKPAFLLVAPSPRSRYWSYEESNYLATASDYAYSLLSSVIVASEFGLTMDRGVVQDFGLRSALYNTVPSTRYARAFDMPKLLGRHLRDEPTIRKDYALDPEARRRTLQSQVRLFGQPEYGKETLVHERMTLRFTDAVMASGTPMSFVEFPMDPVLLARLPDWHQPLQQARASLGEVAARHGLAHLSRDSLPYFGRKMFFDGTHLDSVGRRRMTHILADHISQQIGTSSPGDD